MGQQRADLQQRFSALIEGDYDYTRPRRGEVCEAVVLSLGDDAVIVDLGVKRDGIILRKDLDLLEDDYRSSLRVGQRVPVRIVDAQGREDGVIVSLNQGLAQQDWLRAQALLESGELYEAEVTGVNRGGVLVSFGRVRGFVPNSHLSSVPPGLQEDRLREAKSDLVGQSLSLTAIEVNQQQRRLVLSERAGNHRRRQQLLEELTEGQVRTGTVRNLVDFGAFVDLGGLDGLIHISELDWKHVEHPSEVLSVGDKVEVYILSVQRDRERIELSRKRLLPDPWPVVTKELEIDQLVEGTVTKVVDFGAFVDIGRGVEGLIHTSEIPEEKGVSASLEPGSPVRVRVLDIDRQRHRIGLSLRNVPGATLS